MPNTYAHWRFGDKCINTLPENYQQIINNNREIYDFGVHGPDIFFYYNALKSNYINQFGHDLHEIPYEETLKKMIQVYNRAEKKDATLSYILGFTAHFVLDSYCHSYIQRKEEVSNEQKPFTSHGRIETQFDKYLLIKDGLDPIKASLTKSLKPSLEIAQVISSLFSSWDEKTIYKALKDQKLYINLLKDTNSFKRALISYILDSKDCSSFKDLMMGKEDYPEVRDSNLRLEKLFAKALKEYPILVNNLLEYIENGKPLDSYFKNTFSVKNNYQKIPVLSLDTEKNYIVE